MEDSKTDQPLSGSEEVADVVVKEPATADEAQTSDKGSFGALRPFVIISSSYLLYTVTDGAIRTIVLLHAFEKGFSALEVAIMFTLYEVAGVVTNLLAGIAGSRWGIRNTLLSGLLLQLAGIGMLFGWQNDFSSRQAIVYVTLAQALCGVAKDLTKLGGKTVTKLVTPDEKQSYLFKLVSFITGFKNSLKGAGYFLGAATVGRYYLSLSILLGIIVLAIPWAAVGLSPALGRSTGKPVTLRDAFKMNYNINVLSAARMFLFGSRDAWFEVPLPFFLRDSLVGLGWSRTVTGLFLALFIIVYGQIQTLSPHLVLGPLRQVPANKYVAMLWASALALMPAILGPLILTSDAFQDRDVPAMTGILTAGVAFFCFVFAVNSAVHSYLVLRYSDGNKVAVNVGFYYMSNAMGRLTGTILSGVLYSFAGSSRVDGFGWCFVLAAAFVIVCVFVTAFVRDDTDGLMCGAYVCVAARDAKQDVAAVEEALQAIEAPPRALRRTTSGGELPPAASVNPVFDSSMDMNGAPGGEAVGSGASGAHSPPKALRRHVFRPALPDSAEAAPPSDNTAVLPSFMSDNSSQYLAPAPVHIPQPQKAPTSG